jgi:ATP-dependent protease HslVU (ClpYQ) ATPase subunit
MMEMTRGGSKSPSVINTKHILFVVSGAFDGLEKLVQKRLREASIGFSQLPHSERPVDALLDLARTSDFIDHGFEPEFIGRLPVRVVCQPLNVDDLFEILQRSEGSIVRQYEQSFQAYGIEVLFREDGLRRIAELAGEEKTGARGLMTVCERTFRDLKFEMPSAPVRRFAVDRPLVDDPKQALKALLQQHEQEEQQLSGQLVDEFALRFEQEHGLSIAFTPPAVARLVAMSSEQAKSVRDICAERFKDFQFGLKLIARNTGQKSFEIDLATVEAPDQQLSQWVVASYRSNT